MATKLETEKSIRWTTPLIGNFNIAELHSATMKELYRGKGFGAEEQMKALKDLAARGYELVIATVSDENDAQKRIMEKNGWRLVWAYHSDCSGHMVRFYVFELHVLNKNKEGNNGP